MSTVGRLIVNGCINVADAYVGGFFYTILIYHLKLCSPPTTTNTNRTLNGEHR
jgi:hypothetical protein